MAEMSSTRVEVSCTGHVRRAIGRRRFEYEFEGTTLRAFLDVFLDEYDIGEMLIATDPDEEAAPGWIALDDPPGTWRSNPPGERTRRYARVCIDGRFCEHLDGLDTDLSNGDRVSLMYPVIYCC